MIRGRFRGRESFSLPERGCQLEASRMPAAVMRA